MDGEKSYGNCPADIQDKYKRRPDNARLTINIGCAGVAAEDLARIFPAGYLKINYREVDRPRQVGNQANYK